MIKLLAVAVIIINYQVLGISLFLLSKTWKVYFHTQLLPPLPTVTYLQNPSIGLNKYRLFFLQNNRLLMPAKP